MALNHTLKPTNYYGLTPAQAWEMLLPDESPVEWYNTIDAEHLAAEVEIRVDYELGDEGDSLDEGDMPWSEGSRVGYASKLIKHIKTEGERAAYDATRV